MMKQHNRQAFTLVEIMIAIAILGLLATIGIPSFQKARQNTMKKSALSNTRLVIFAVNEYNLEEGYPGSNNVMVSEIADYLKGGIEGMKVGEINIDKEAIANGTESPADLVATLYPAIN